MVLTAILGFSQPNSGYNEYQRQEVLNFDLKEILSRKNVEFSETGEVKITSTITKEELISSFTDGENYQLKLRTTSNRRLKPGSTYFLYDQYFKGLAVEGGGLTIEESVSGVVTMWPKLFDKIDIPVVPRINNSDLEKIFGDIQSTEMIISRRFSDAYLLVYKVEFTSSGSKVAFVDANTGKVLLEHINGSNLTGSTVDYGSQNLNYRTVGNVTTLESPDQTIQIFRDFDTSVIPDCFFDDIPSTTNTVDWGTDASAHCIQIFFSTTEVLNEFSNIGINFTNVDLDCGSKFLNAISWNCLDFPEASIEMGFLGPHSTSVHDVVAHELAHTYARQFIDPFQNFDPASIHEGLADIFGVLPCKDEMLELYRTVYILRLKNQDEKLNESDLNYLRQVASRCASEYGDAVHWAMGLLSSYTTELPDTVDDCNEDSIECRSRSLVNKDVITSKVYPNPVSTELTVELSGAAGQVILSDITGQVIIRSDLQEGDNIISVESLNSGLYLIKIQTVDYEKIEKITVTR
jgi:hypothetical protein